MTVEEFSNILKGIQAIYPRESICPDDESKSVWFKLLKDLEYSVCQAAVLKLVCSSKFAPTIAEIREQASQIIQPERKNWLEGWGMVQKTLHSVGMHRPQEAFERLRQFDETTARVAEMMGWQNLCLSENPVADRANFRQCYETMQKRETDALKLPSSVSRVVEQISSDMGTKKLISGEKQG